MQLKWSSGVGSPLICPSYEALPSPIIRALEPHLVDLHVTCVLADIDCIILQIPYLKYC